MNSNPLPPGQRELEHFPRFGLAKFATRFPTDIKNGDITIGGQIETPFVLNNRLDELDRTNQITDFHCVTTWTKRNVQWGGYKFSDVFKSLVEPTLDLQSKEMLVLFSCQDGYRVGMQLQDLLEAGVILADTMDGEPLTVAHGAPFRLIAPSHYGYKNAKHLKRIEFFLPGHHYKRAGLKFMDHPRARVAFEERGSIFPGWFLRYLYRPLVNPTIKKFRDAMAQAKQPDSE